MTEKQIEKIRFSIKKHRNALMAEKRLHKGFDDSAGRRYHITDLYIKISDYKGLITYKKWFDKNFPDDIGGPLLSLNWTLGYFGIGLITETKIYTIDTAFQNVYLHGLILNQEVSRIDMYDNGYDMLDYAKSIINENKKIITQQYIDWLAIFINTDEYKNPVNRFVALNKLLKDESNHENRIELFNHIRDLEKMNKIQIK